MTNTTLTEGTEKMTLGRYLVLFVVTDENRTDAYTRGIRWMAQNAKRVESDIGVSQAEVKAWAQKTLFGR